MQNARPVAPQGIGWMTDDTRTGERTTVQGFATLTANERVARVRAWDVTAFCRPRLPLIPHFAGT